MTVFPYVAGTAGTWGEPLGTEMRRALLHDLIRLHGVRGKWITSVPVRPLDLPERPQLMAALASLDDPWRGGPQAEPARRAMAEHADRVRGWLAELDRLAARVRAADADPVITHGEPHPGNLISTDTGLRLIDWDTVARAVPERDLWMLDDGSPDPFGAYEERAGRAIDAAAVAFYRLAWTLSDIAAFAELFRSPHQPTQWIQQKWEGLLRLLAGAPSQPHGPA